MNEIEAANNELSSLYTKRDNAQKIVDDYQKKINHLKKYISSQRAEEKKAEEKRKQTDAMLELSKLNSIWINEKLNIDSVTKDFIKKEIYRNDRDISIAQLRTYTEELFQTYPEKRRIVFIVNERAKGLSFNAIGEKLDISGQRVRQILEEFRKRLLHPKVGRRILIKETY